jgi:hypothetical protein
LRPANQPERFWPFARKMLDTPILPPTKTPPRYPLNRRAEWVSKPVSMLWRRDIFLVVIIVIVFSIILYFCLDDGRESEGFLIKQVTASAITKYSDRPQNTGLPAPKHVVLHV